MKKFNFDLQGVLEIKEKLEGQAKINFGIARARLTAEENKRDEILARKEEYRARLEKLVNGDLDVTEIGRCSDAIDIIDEQLSNQEMMVKRAEKQLELMRTRLNTVVMERKTIEKLREKRFAEYLQEYNDEERKQVDELVSYRHSTAEPEDEEERTRTGQMHGAGTE